MARDKAEREYQKTVNDLATLKAALANAAAQWWRGAAGVAAVRAARADGTGGQLSARRRRASRRSRACARWWRRPNRACACSRPLKPQIFAFGQYDFRRRDEMLTDPDWAFGIGLKYTFLSPNSRPAQISRACAAVTRPKRACARPRTRSHCAQGLNELETARQQFVLLDSSIAQAQENLRLQELAFREGQATSLDVIDARLTWAAPCRARTGRHQYDIALAQLLEISGQMDRFEEFGGVRTR